MNLEQIIKGNEGKTFGVNWKGDVIYFDEKIVEAREQGLIYLSCPLALEVSCRNNKLTKLYCPKAEYVSCSHNELTELSCPKAKKVYCLFNKLRSLHCPKAEFVSCRGNMFKTLYCPKASMVYCKNNEELEKIFVTEKAVVEKDKHTQIIYSKPNNSIFNIF